MFESKVYHPFGWLSNLRKSQAFVSAMKTDGCLPLTPALSLGEREKRSPRQSKAMAASCSNDGQKSEDKQRLFLLPKGEGQDEGKAHSNYNEFRSG